MIAKGPSRIPSVSSRLLSPASRPRVGGRSRARLLPRCTGTSELDREALMSIDQLFQEAVALIGAGDVPALDRLLTDHPELSRERLSAPGRWLRDKIGGAL